MCASFPSIDTMVANVHAERGYSLPTWSLNELRTIESTKRKLRSLHPAEPIDTFFKTVRSCYPLEGGMIESYLPFEALDVTDVLYEISDAFISAVVQRANSDPAVEVASRLPAGVAYRIVDAVPESTLREIPFFQATFTPYEFASSSVLTVATGRATRPDENVALYLFHAKGERAPMWRDCRVLELIRADIESALKRMRLPVLPNEPIRHHIMRSEHIGYAIVRRDLKVIEANGKSYAIAAQYVDGRGGVIGCAPLVSLLRLVVHVGLGGISAGALRMRRDGGAVLRAKVYKLDKDLVELPESVFLVELDELPIHYESPQLPLQDVTPEQQPFADPMAMSGGAPEEISEELNQTLNRLDDVEQRIIQEMVYTRVPNKQIAATMSLSLRAFEKRVQRIAEKLKVHVSRGERVRPILTELLHGKLPALRGPHGSACRCSYSCRI